MKTLSKLALLMGTTAMALYSGSADAQERIVRPYQSVRSAGMGNVRYTTGLYDQNFFANPARVTQNPAWKLTLLDPMVEVSSPVPGALSGMLNGGSDFYKQVGEGAGENYHARFQTTMPSIYMPPGEDGKWGYAIGLITSTQADVNLRRSFNIDPTVITEIGPHVTVGRKLLENDELSVGMNAHLTYRLSSNTGFTFIDLIQGKSLSPTKTGGQGSGLDFDVGATYDFIHWKPLGIEFAAAFAVNNILDGRYSNISFRPIKQNGQPMPANRPVQQPRTFNVGASATKPSIGILRDTVVAFEITDIGNNDNGSMFRTVHIGGETKLGLFSFRGGINQGYLAAGLGINLKILEIDAATYGEELSLNPGGLEDRRYALRLAFQI